MDLKKYSIVIVRWTDACEFDRLLDADKALPIRESIGYLVRNDNLAVAVCWMRDIKSTFDVAQDSDESEGIVVPREMVVNIEKIGDGVSEEKL